jgi:c-di-GMP-related signal transduction protein
MRQEQFPCAKNSSLVSLFLTTGSSLSPTSYYFAMEDLVKKDPSLVCTLLLYLNSFFLARLRDEIHSVRDAFPCLGTEYCRWVSILAGVTMASTNRPS